MRSEALICEGSRTANWSVVTHTSGFDLRHRCRPNSTVLHRSGNRTLSCPGRNVTRILAWGKQAKTYEGISATPPPPPRLQGLPTSFSLTWLIALQAFALVGCLVTGTLARRRRLEVEGLNSRLRQIVAELRSRTAEEEIVCEVNVEEAAKAYRSALEAALGSPAAAHPLEGFGEDNLSLAQARQKISRLLREGKTALHCGEFEAALPMALEARSLAEELHDVRAQRAILRFLARVSRAKGEIRSSLEALKESMDLSEQLPDKSGDVDVLGAIADAYADLGDLEQAGMYYDRCFAAIKDESSGASVQASVSWDC